MDFTTEKELTLDIYQSSLQTVYAKQYDQKTRFLKVKLSEKGEFIDVSEWDDCGVYLKAKTIKNRNIYQDCVIQSDGTILVELTDNVLHDHGNTKAEIVIVNRVNDKILSSIPFIINVVGSAFEDEDVSEEEYSVFYEIIKRNEEVLHHIEEDLEELESEMDTLVKKSQLGVPSTDTEIGVATLNTSGVVPESQLPSYVDDVLEGVAQRVTQSVTGDYLAEGFILAGESSECVPEEGKIYLDTTTNIQYRWTGSIFISIGSHLALGETSATAFPGNRGKILEEDMSSVQQDISKLQEDVSVVVQDLSEVQEDVSGLQQEVSGMNNWSIQIDGTKLEINTI